MQPPATPVPWVVAETVALKVATLQPRRVAIVPDDPRLDQAVNDANTELGLDACLCPIDGPDTVDLLVWVSARGRPRAGARRDLLQHVARSTGDVIVCERVVDGHGLGADVLSRIDAGARRLATDEIEDDDFGVRTRKPWEAPVLWLVAEAAAWRFLSDAEMARSGFIRRLPRMSAAQMVMACRRILSRFDTAHELLVLALSELVRRRDVDGVHAVMRELGLRPEAPRSMRRRAEDLTANLEAERPTQQMPVAV